MASIEGLENHAGRKRGPMHPFGDIVDTEDDLQPLVASAFGDATRAVALVSAALRGASLNVARMRERAGQHGVSITELADTLVRDHGVSFRVGHGIAARLSARLGEGVLNGLLTARVGLSAMAVCRPMPFTAKAAPGVNDVAPFLFTAGKKD